MALKHYDKLETRSPAAREKALMAALPKLIAHAQKNAPGFARILKGIKASAVNSRGATSNPRGEG